MDYFNKKAEDSLIDNISDFFKIEKENFYVKIPKRLINDWSKEGWVEAISDIEFWTRAIQKSLEREDFDYKFFLDYS